jgi:hypothetical protein
MSFHIHEFSNLSPKSVLLTNPVALRDTHLLPIASSVKLEYPPLINVVTGTNNWCFWDYGENNALHMQGEMVWKVEDVIFSKPASQLGLRIDHSGKPTFYVIK